MVNLRRSSGLLGLAVAAATAAGLSASPAHAGLTGPVGPRQYFTGVINGHDGNTTTPITIRMACGSLVHSGQTGHPQSGQTLAVHQLFPPAATTVGYTGTGSEIGPFFNAPPPGGARPDVAAPVFIRYDRTRPLPTSVTLPCSGTGTVWFSPIPVIPPSRSASVPVRYVSPP